jgi:predicted molibdopterin-dependent oxidoreductase YjgC
VLDDAAAAVRTNGALIYLGTTLPDDAEVRGADVVLPLANVAEEDGTFVNRDGRVQRYAQARPAPGMARPAWWVLGELAAGGGEPAPASAAEAFARFAAATEGAAGMSYATLGLAGRVMGTGAGVPA